MTKEQAIKVLSDYDGYFIGHSSDEVNEALEMAISALKEPTWQEKLEKTYLLESIKEDLTKFEAENERLFKEVEVLEDGKWIPIKDIEDIPKTGSYWVTREYGFDILVEKIRWSDAWRCWVDKDDDSVITKESAEIITAYMPYFEPEPYKKEVSE